MHEANGAAADSCARRRLFASVRTAVLGHCGPARSDEFKVQPSGYIFCESEHSPLPNLPHFALKASIANTRQHLIRQRNPETLLSLTSPMFRK